jgi:hypothetical protein
MRKLVCELQRLLFVGKLSDVCYQGKQAVRTASERSQRRRTTGLFPCYDTPREESRRGRSCQDSVVGEIGNRELSEITEDWCKGLRATIIPLQV